MSDNIKLGVEEEASEAVEEVEDIEEEEDTIREENSTITTAKTNMKSHTRANHTEIMKKNGITQMLSTKIERNLDLKLKRRRMKMK